MGYLGIRHAWMSLGLAVLVLSAAVAAEPSAPVVDEPLGARYSLGMTLWHLGHNPELIGRFHEFVKAQGTTPESLLPAASLTPPGG